ncbi:hypothetical protein E2562_032311, partial [Oryza meyeriana var. granulata]
QASRQAADVKPLPPPPPRRSRSCHCQPDPTPASVSTLDAREGACMHVHSQIEPRTTHPPPPEDLPLLRATASSAPAISHRDSTTIGFTR